MARSLRPTPLRFGFLLIVFGGLALAFAAWGIATLATPGESLPPDADRAAAEEALERFRLRLDLNARLQGSGLGLLAAGTVLVGAGLGAQRGRTRALAGTTGVAAALLIVLGRWRSVALDQFGPAWDHWVLAEAAGWLVWVVALAVLVLPGSEAEGAGRAP